MRRQLVVLIFLAGLVGLPAAAGLGTVHLLSPAREAAQLSLPARIGIPWPWTPTVYQSAARSTALIFGGPAMPMTTVNDDTNIVIAGGDEDTYRLLPISGPAFPGQDVRLSPDGTKVAFAAFSPEKTTELHILDLRDNRITELTLPDAQTDFLTLLSWAPDGSRMAIKWDGGDRSEIGVIDVATGRYRRLAAVDGDNGSPHGAAFTPDGSRLSYQDRQTVTTVRLDGTKESSFTVAKDAYLAGKGAWRPDAKAVALSLKTPTGWQLRLVDPATGETVAGNDFPEVQGVTTIRLLGWQKGSIPVAVGFLAEKDAPPQLNGPDLTLKDYVRSVEVLRMPSGAGHAETVLTSPGQVLEIDIADQVVASGAVRAGGGAPIWPARPVWVAGGVAVSEIVILVIACGVLRWRRRKATAQTTTGTNRQQNGPHDDQAGHGRTVSSLP